MKKLLLALALLLTPSLAWAQCTGIFPASNICGTVAGGVPGPVPNSVLTGIPGGSPNQTQYNIGGTTFGGYTPSGDVTVNPATGVETIQPNAITTGKINAAAVTNAKINAGAVNTVKSTLDGTTTTDNLITTLINATCTLSPSTCATLFGYYNIVWYGAVSGADTASRNSNALFAVYTACANNPGSIFVPQGNYQYASAQAHTTSACSVSGTGQGASILSYTGVGIALAIGNSGGSNLAQILYRDIQIACTSTCTNVVYIQNVSEAIVFDNVALNAGNTGNHAVQLTSATISTGGSFDVHFVNGTVIQNCVLQCAYLNPLAFGLVNAIYFSDVFWNGYQAEALSATSGTGIFVNHSHIERHLGASVTTAAVHFDNMVMYGIRDTYFEDEANAYQVDLGGGNSRGFFDGDIVGTNALGGSHSNAGFLKYNGAGTPPAGLAITNTLVTSAGTVGNVIDLGASTAVSIGNVTLSIVNATWGIASSLTQADVDVFNLTASGAYSSGASQITKAVTCPAGSPSGSFTANGAGRVTHC